MRALGAWRGFGTGIWLEQTVAAIVYYDGRPGHLQARKPMAVQKVACPKCTKAFGVLPRQMGTEVHCPHCGQRIRLPGGSGVRAGATAAAGPGGPSVQEEALAQMFGAGPDSQAGPVAASTSPAAAQAPVDPVAELEAAAQAARASAPHVAAASRPAAVSGAAGHPAGVHPAGAGRPAGGDPAGRVRSMHDLMGSAAEHHPSGALAATPVRSKTALWVWVGILGAVIIALVVGTILFNNKRNRDRADGAAAQQQSDAKT